MKHSLFKSIQAMWGIKSWLCCIILALSLIFTAIGQLCLHYTFNYNFISPTILLTTPSAFLLFIASLYLRDEVPRAALILQTLWILPATILVSQLYANAIQFTPFPTHDALFYQIDKYLGFDLVDFIAWTRSFPYFSNILNHTYSSLIWLLLLTPVLLALFNKEKEVNEFFMLILTGSLLGYTFYYFYPSTDPSSVIQSPYFSDVEHMVVQRFHELHSHLATQIGTMGGLIGFPSFHVIWAITVSYVFRNLKIIFYPLIIWNILLFLSTLSTGWHFLSDILGGFVFIGLSIIISRYLVKLSPDL